MNLGEVRNAATEAVRLATEAQATVTNYVIEGLRAAYEAMQSIEQIGPVAHQESGNPYNLDDARQRFTMVNDLLLVVNAALETASEYAHTASNQITDARDKLRPTLPEGFKWVADAMEHLDAADTILSGLFEVGGDILPITGETAAFRIGQAVNELNQLIAMLK